MKILFPMFLFVVLINLSAVSQTDPLMDNNEALLDTTVEKSQDKKQYKWVSNFKIYGGVSTCYE
ncbi:hypothetical protein [uncultured Draconibacterium sp.]|uniref:hypothetical protein n=1 Tax=uncultured Draconibacterium sp. TaxID=1573823 RepID=UPI0029C70677|nr:hypothetical protein [uncultured Draconibacterium sp.]